MSRIYSPRVMYKLLTIAHYIQLINYINSHCEINIKYKKTDSIKTIQQNIDEFKIPESILLELIGEMEKYRFYIENTNEYCNTLTLLQFFKCIEYPNPTYRYKYNIFYKKKYIYESPPIETKYIKCFGKALIRGDGHMDFRLLPIEHFKTWIKILGNDYVIDSKTFAKYEIEYTQEYTKYTIERNNFIYISNSQINWCKSLFQHYVMWIKKSSQKKILELQEQILILQKQVLILEDIPNF